jgi:hypothetical protein
MPRRLVSVTVLGGLLLLGAMVRGAAAADEQAAAQPAKFSNDQLDQIVAPVALYPDSLLSQVFIASTYPLEVVEADRWRRQHSDLKDAALDQALDSEDWDPSVLGLTHFPDVLKQMSDNLDWTKDMGDAFLAQQGDLMDAVQRMRVRAQDAGTLKTTKQQTVSTETVSTESVSGGAPSEKQTIVIQPADPQVVYVPSYAPSQVYGSYAPPQPYYPAVYSGYSPGAVAATGLLSFGLGVGVGALVTDGFDWGHHDAWVNNNYYGGGHGSWSNNVNVNRNANINNANINRRNVAANRQNWNYNPEHRRNVGYRDPGTAKRYGGRTGPATAQQRQDLARGFDRADVGGRAGQGARAGQGTRAGQAGAQRPNRPAASAGVRGPGDRGGAAGARKPGDRGAGMGAKGPGGGGGAQRQARPATTGGRQGAFNGAGDGRGARQASQRGAASRGGASMAGAGRSTAGRGGGGGGFKGGGGGGGFKGGGGRGGGGGGGGRGGGGRRR